MIMTKYIGIENFQEIPINNIDELISSIDRYGDLLFSVFNDGYDSPAVFTNFKYLDFGKRGLPLIYDIYNSSGMDEEGEWIDDLDEALNNPNNTRRNPFHLTLKGGETELKSWTFYIKSPAFSPKMLNWPIEFWKSKNE